MKMTDQWRKLRQDLKGLKETPKEWRKQDFDLFFEIEFGLFVYQSIVPSEIEQNCEKASTLFSGYFTTDIHTDVEAQKISLAARNILQYVRSSSAWSNWFKWYAEQPQHIRLYEIDLKSGDFRQRTVNVVYKQERIASFNTKLHSPTQTQATYEINWAQPGRYTFTVHGEIMEVNLSEEIVLLANHASSPKAPRSKPKREELDISFESLHEVAYTIQELDKSRDWNAWLSEVELSTINGDKIFDHQKSFKIKDIFHLVGRVGAGKSTLIQLLTFYLAQQGKHVTIISNTVVEAARLANWFRKVGVKATPALGTNRASHRLKFGQANQNSLNAESIFKPFAENVPALDWFTGSCALSGMTSQSIPIDSLPCYSLHGEDGNTYTCPVQPVCSIHKSERDLIDSQVWIVNPYSFLYSRAPQNLGYGVVKIFEAVYKHSDLLIIDEADRVQVQWDRIFAPVNDLAGSDNALLDVLHANMATQSMGHRGRQRIRRTHYQRLKDLDNQANMLSDHILRLLFKEPELVKWVKRRQLTNLDMYRRLATDLARNNLDPRGKVNEDIRLTLDSAFKEYWRDPLIRESGELSEWVSEIVVRSADMSPETPLNNLKIWLKKYISWDIDKSPYLNNVLLRLQFALLLTALIKRTNDILNQLSWASEETGELFIGEFQLPDEIFDLIPEPPLGNVLGLRYFDNEIQQSGSLKYLKYLGIGRWFLLNFYRLYENILEIDGPHIFLTSATSWAPQSSYYHIAHEPDAVLSPPDNKGTQHIDLVKAEFQPITTSDGFLRISGARGSRTSNLRDMVRRLAYSAKMNVSPVQRELDYWGNKRRILFVVGSYDDARIVWETLDASPEWTGRSIRMLPDDSEVVSEGSIFAREVEKLHNYEAEILIAPLLAIQRGFNILDDDGALLGSAFFLVRPYPVPDDISQHINSLNAWAIKQLDDGRFLSEEYANLGTKAVGEYRRRAYIEWHKRLTSGKYGMDSIHNDLYPEFLWNQFVVVWQTIGRLIRGERHARVFFVDEAFYPEKQKRKMILDWAAMLEQEFSSDNEVHRQLMHRLYGTAYDAFEKLIQTLGVTTDA